jgi:phosphoribosylformimino-5-aminoimidazole carboxamide ribotide isomerase
VILFPAIDVRAGRVVRLSQGDFARETVYGDSPADVAESFVVAGAGWVHLVDLDAARGDGSNHDAIAEVAARLSNRARLQVGGGVRSVDVAQKLADLGVARVVMGSAAVRTPELVDAVASIVDVAVGLDHRNGEVAVDGWTAGSSLQLDAALRRYAAASAFIITDISRDGMLVGPDLDGLVAASAATSVPVVASGGVGSLDDLRALRDARVISGVIVGRALYEGKFALSEALAVASR